MVHITRFVQRSWTTSKPYFDSLLHPVEHSYFAVIVYIYMDKRLEKSAWFTSAKPVGVIPHRKLGVLFPIFIFRHDFPLFFILEMRMWRFSGRYSRRIRRGEFPVFNNIKKTNSSNRYGLIKKNFSKTKKKYSNDVFQRSNQLPTHRQPG